MKRNYVSQGITSISSKSPWKPETESCFCIKVINTNKDEDIQESPSFDNTYLSRAL